MLNNAGRQGDLFLFCTTCSQSASLSCSAGVIIDQSLGYTATAEIRTSEAPNSLLQKPGLFQDSYRIRLSKQPDHNVTISVKSIATATDRETPSTANLKNRAYGERVQVEMKGSSDLSPKETIALLFTKDNWSQWQKVDVIAKDDDQEEGVDLLYFPSQPRWV